MKPLEREADDLPLFSFARDLRKEEAEQESEAEGGEPVFFDGASKYRMILPQRFQEKAKLQDL